MNHQTAPPHDPAVFRSPSESILGADSVRRCYSCGVEQPLSAFPRDRTKKSGRMSICRPCDTRKRARYAAVKPPRMCPCGQPARSQRHKYCEGCGLLAEMLRRKKSGSVKASSAARGYGHAHQKMRKRVALLVEAGGACCARCGDPIVPGSPWDLGHDDLDRSLYVGPEHRRCNRATAGRRKRRHSRVW